MSKHGRPCVCVLSGAVRPSVGRCAIRMTAAMSDSCVCVSICTARPSVRPAAILETAAMLDSCVYVSRGAMTAVHPSLRPAAVSDSCVYVSRGAMTAVHPSIRPAAVSDSCVLLLLLQGSTIKPLVNFLKVKKAETHKTNMNEQIHVRVSDRFTVASSWLHPWLHLWLHPWLHVAPCLFCLGFSVPSPGFTHGFTHGFMWLPVCFALASSWLHRGFPLASPMASCGSLSVLSWLHHGFTVASPWLHPWLHVAPCLFCLGFTMASPWLHSCFTWLPVCLIVASPWLPYS